MGQPDKVLITGGRKVGGFNSFEMALSEDFHQLRVPRAVGSSRKVLQELPFRV